MNHDDDLSILPPRQNYVCLSFLKNDEISAIKVRGVFNVYEDACKHAKNLQTIDTSFDIYVGEVGKWMPMNPNEKQVHNVEYADEKLDKLIKGHVTSQEQIKHIHEKRKNEMLKHKILETIDNRKESLTEYENALNSDAGDAGDAGEGETPAKSTELKDTNISNEDIKSSMEAVTKNIEELNIQKDELDKQIQENEEMIKKFSPP